jgi:hypothetical protein
VPQPPLEYRPPPRRWLRAQARRLRPIGGVSGLIVLFETREEFENKKLELKKKIEEMGENESAGERVTNVMSGNGGDPPDGGRGEGGSTHRESLDDCESEDEESHDDAAQCVMPCNVEYRAMNNAAR